MASEQGRHIYPIPELRWIHPTLEVKSLQKLYEAGLENIDFARSGLPVEDQVQKIERFAEILFSTAEKLEPYRDLVLSPDINLDPSLLPEYFETPVGPVNLQALAVQLLGGGEDNG